LSRVTYLLRKLKSCVNLDTLLLTYYGLFHSHLCSGIRLWGNSSAAKKVFIWQKKAIRIIAGLPTQSSCRRSFARLQILTMACIYILQNLVYVRENLSKFETHSTLHNHDTRGKENLVLPNVRLDKSYKSHYYQQLKLFNKIPSNIRSLPINKFKQTLSDWLKNKEFYSIDEFLSCEVFELV